jgi:hypothetical protein
VSDEGGQAVIPWQRVAVALACMALAAIPFLCVQFPPIVDLPQHVAQVRLFWEALSDPHSAYRIQWLTPYGLSYVLLGGAWALASPENAGRLAMLALGALWVATAHFLAAARGRPAAAAIVASALLFNHTLYWGFSSFVIGWPAFAIWFVLTSGRHAHATGWRTSAELLAAAIVLYFSHALWLAAGTLWFFVSQAFNRTSLRTTLLRFLSFAPVLIVVAIWYPSLSARGFDSSTRWFTTPSGRLSASWLADAILGALRGPVEPLIVVAVLGWAALGAYQHRHALATTADRELLLAAALLACLALLLPDLRTNTIMFAKRWAPCAVVLLLLATPPPRWRPSAHYAVAFAVLVAVVGTTTSAWIRIDRREYAGLAASLRALPERQRVLGLDLARHSDFVKGRPFLQTFAYAQVWRGGELNFSFADFAPSPVVYKTGRIPTWTNGLDWYPDLVQQSDLEQFDYALVNADDAMHRSFVERFAVAPAVSDQGRWRLYRLRSS